MYEGGKIMLRKHRTGFLMLVLFILLSTVNACGIKSSKTETEATKKTETTAQAEATTEAKETKPLSIAKVTLWWPWGGPANPQTSFDSEFSNFLAEKIGVRVSLSPCQTDSSQALNLFRASKNLPDVVLTGPWLDGAIQWYEEGNTIALNKYFKDEKNYPNLAAVSESVLNFYKNDKGEIVCLPAGPPVMSDLNAPLDEGAIKNCMQSYGYFARKDLYEEYNKPITTVEEIDQFLRWCKGKKALDGTNVIPLGIPRWDPAPAVEWFLIPFGGRSGPMVDNEGKVMIPEVSKPYYNMMWQLNRWFQEGLISREIFTDNFDAYEQKIAAAKFGLIYGSSWATDSYNSRMNNEKTQYIPISYWKAANVDKFLANPDTVANPSMMGWAQIVVSSACKDPDAVMRFIDYMTSKEGYISGMSGVPEKYWTLKDENTYALSELGKKIHPSGGNKDWITEAGKHGNFATYQYGLFGSSSLKLEGQVEPQIYEMAREAWKGHTGTLYGHRRATIDMSPATEAQLTQNNNWLPEKAKWILSIMSAKTKEEFDKAYKKGLEKNKDLLMTIESEIEKSWKSFKGKHSDLVDDPNWYGPVERVFEWK